MLTPSRPPTGIRGFTLVELLVAVVVLGVLASLGAPSFRDFIQRGQVRTASESVQNALQIARAEAVRRNARVRFVLGAQSGSSSWSVNIDTDGSIVQQSQPSGEGSGTVTATATPANATTVTFNAFGRVVDNTDGSARLTQVDVNNTAAPAGSQRRIVVTPGGSIRLCNPDTSLASTDPTKC